MSLSENSLTEIKNEVFIFSGKELNDINDIKLTKINHQKYVLDQLLSKAYSKNFMVNMSRKILISTGMKLHPKNLATIQHMN